MWHQDSGERLAAWHDLRVRVADVAIHDCLLTINDWWFQCPIGSPTLQWQTVKSWPGPWDLLIDNDFCDLARAAGIMYTIIILGRQDIASVDLIRTKDDNLVQVNDGKYILNWAPGQLLNIRSDRVQVVDQIPSGILHHKIR